MANKKISDLTALAASDASAPANQLEAFAPALAVGTRSRSVRFDVLRGALQRLGSCFDLGDPKYGGSPSASAATNDAAFAAALADLPSTGGFITIGPGEWSFSAMPITRRGVRLIGARDGRVTQGGGTRLLFKPTSQANPVALIQLGTSGVTNDPFFDASYATANYGGPQELYVENISIAYGGSTRTTLANGRNNYGTNTVAIRDFFAGSVRLRNVQFEQLQYGFWGVQSDFDDFDDVTALYCQVGVYQGPRSDQFRTKNLEVSTCDHGLWLDRCAGSVHVGLSSIDNGTSTLRGIRLGSQYADAGCESHTFVEPWLEVGADAGSPNEDAFFEFGGSTDAQPTRDITVIQPLILTAIQSSTPHTAYLATVGNGTRLRFLGLSNGHTNLLKTFKFTSASVNSHVFVDTHDDLTPTYDNPGGATPTVSYRSSGYGSHTFGGGNGRVQVNYTPQASNYANNYFFGSESQFGFFVQFPNRDNTGGAANILAITRRIRHASAVPTTGTWTAGDITFNTAPSVGAPTYWLCTSSGTPGTWVPMAIVPGVSSNRGDASVTLTAGTDATTQKFNTPLTANRTVTLSTTGAWNGAKFRVVRTAAATGASTLTVGSKVLAVGQWVDHEYDGSAWMQTAFGSL